MKKLEDCKAENQREREIANCQQMSNCYHCYLYKKKGDDKKMKTITCDNCGEDVEESKYYLQDGNCFSCCKNFDLGINDLLDFITLMFGLKGL